MEDEFPVSQRDVRRERKQVGPFPRVSGRKNDAKNHFDRLHAASELVPGC